MDLKIGVCGKDSIPLSQLYYKDSNLIYKLQEIDAIDGIVKNI